MGCSLAELGFSGWPFATVPDDYNTTFSCDRTSLVEKTDALLDAYMLRPSTIINLVWSDVGAGKTHTLKNIIYKAQLRGFQSCLYFEMPERAANFVEVHDAIIAVAGLDRILDSFAENQQPFAQAPVLNQLARSSYTGYNTELAARAWVSGTASASEKRLLGVPRDLTPQQAIQNVVALVQALATGTPQRTILLVDEFQRVAQRSSAASKAVQNGLCSLINALPTGLGLILAFQAAPSSDLPGWIDPSLVSRAGKSHFVPILVLSRTEALEFLHQIIQRYALPKKNNIFPFTEPVLSKLVELSGGDRVLPRDLLAQAGNALEHYMTSENSGTREMTVAEVGNRL